MGDRGNVGPRNIQQVNTPQCLLIGVHLDPTVLADIGNEQHVRAVDIELEIVGYALAEHRRREWPKRFAVFDLQVHYLSLIHISEPTRLLSISYAVFCLKKKTTGCLA